MIEEFREGIFQFFQRDFLFARIEIEGMQVSVFRFQIIRQQGIALKGIAEDRIVVDIDQTLELMVEWLIRIKETEVDAVASQRIVLLDDVVLIEGGAAVFIDLVLGLRAVHVGLAKRLHGDRLEGDQEGVELILVDMHRIGQKDVVFVIHRHIGTETQEFHTVLIKRYRPVFPDAVNRSLAAKFIPGIIDFLLSVILWLEIDKRRHLFVVQ